MKRFRPGVLRRRLHGSSSLAPEINPGQGLPKTFKTRGKSFALVHYLTIKFQIRHNSNRKTSEVRCHAW